MVSERTFCVHAQIMAATRIWLPSRGRRDRKRAGIRERLGDDRVQLGEEAGLELNEDRHGFESGEGPSRVDADRTPRIFSGMLE